MTNVNTIISNIRGYTLSKIKPEFPNLGFSSHTETYKSQIHQLARIIDFIALTQNTTHCTYSLHVFYSRSLCHRGHVLYSELLTLVRVGLNVCLYVRQVCVYVFVLLPFYAHCMQPAHSAPPPIGPDSSRPPCSAVGGGVGVGEQALKKAPVTHYPTIHPPVMSSAPSKHLLPCSSPFLCPLSSGSDSGHSAPCAYTYSLIAWRRKEILFNGCQSRFCVCVCVFMRVCNLMPHARPIH